MRSGRKARREGENGVFEVGEPATTLLTVCTGWIGNGKGKMGMHEASRKIRRRAVGEDRY